MHCERHFPDQDDNGDCFAAIQSDRNLTQTRPVRHDIPLSEINSKRSTVLSSGRAFEFFVSPAALGPVCHHGPTEPFTVGSVLSCFASVVFAKGYPFTIPQMFSFSMSTVLTADMVLNKGRPPGKNGKKKRMFTVLNADMILKKGALPSKN